MTPKTLKIPRSVGKRFTMLQEFGGRERLSNAISQKEAAVFVSLFVLKTRRQVRDGLSGAIGCSSLHSALSGGGSRKIYGTTL